ncbi:carboxymuconolactone decarboxylase family protein [Acidithiobacillus sulfurivorans]|uniref:Carboxymuconolactone decarboxylase family protein n=1 Tax=Acidithiobacillus sulfurivorans TaxID=1958756 RepID=A0ABS6A136_9PROT|nr:carboxymuconolactone decarboxylase family protein [Acidithiobacillus sulfurivorans]MBU2761204.1 carboxymuconolactone decarboxylase family protein [Acidithiobacillus sulfurivorans]
MTAKERIADVKQLMENLKQDYPAEINSFLGFMGKAEGNPALSAVQKELINVALSVAAQCEWCIALHTKNAIEAGAGRDEIMSAGFMAVIMHGGPALMYLVPLNKALDELLPEDHHG